MIQLPVTSRTRRMRSRWNPVPLVVRTLAMATAEARAISRADLTRCPVRIPGEATEGRQVRPEHFEGLVDELERDLCASWRVGLRVAMAVMGRCSCSGYCSPCVRLC